VIFISEHVTDAQGPVFSPPTSCSITKLAEGMQYFVGPVQHRITLFLDFVHFPGFYALENTSFWNVHLVPFSGEKVDACEVGPLKRTDLNHS
jgi:hypothetical protein